MKRGQRTRIARLKCRSPRERPDNFDSMSGTEQLAWLIENGETLSRLLSDDYGGETCKPAAGAALQPQPAPEPPAEVALPPAPVKTRPAPPAKTPHRPRYPGEPDPSYVPPPPNQYAEEMCRWRARGPDDYYDDQPPEEDELDDLIYGNG
jgi:hypothetical protein